MVNQFYEQLLQQLLKQETTVLQLSDHDCRFLLKYLILKLRLKF